ncbi:cytochrome P450 [Hyaloraphidium curvatum]|nr:cytochrome P450 [Hyaloraphidium curvatum]
MDLTSALFSAAAVAAALYLLKLLYFKLFIDVSDDIPTVTFVPFLTTPREKLASAHTLAMEGIKQRGPVFRSVNLIRPSMREIVVGDPLLLKEIYVGTSWKKWGRAGPNAEPALPYAEGIILAQNDQSWHDHRAMFDRTFSTVNVRKYTPILLDLRSVLVDQLGKAAAAHPDGFDIYPFFHRFTFDTITRLVFGSEIGAQTTEEGAKYSSHFDSWLVQATIMGFLKAFFGKWTWKLIPGVVSKWREDGNVMWGLVQRERERVDRGEVRSAIMDDAVAIFKSEKVSPLITEQSMRSALMSILFAGHDTTAALLGFMTYELSQRPDLQAQIRAEVNEVCPGELSNLEVLEKCKVLNACIKETLRRYPSAPIGAGRYVFEDFDFKYTGIDGQERLIKFRKGDQVSTYLWGIQNNPAYWVRNPMQWLPERFYEDSTSGDTKAGLFAYAPFGNGARRCLGERLALAEARLCIASIVRKYDIQHVPCNFFEQYTGTTKPSQVMVTLREVKA